MGSIKNILIAFFLLSPLSSNLAEASSEECFVIEDGVLKDYLCQDTEVVIPNNVVEIASTALQKKGLTKVTFHPNLKIIHSYALSFNKLTHLELPPLEEIDNGAFLGNPIKTLIIALSHLSRLGPAAFDPEIYQELCPQSADNTVRHKACTTAPTSSPYSRAYSRP